MHENILKVPSTKKYAVVCHRAIELMDKAKPWSNSLDEFWIILTTSSNNDHTNRHNTSCIFYWYVIWVLYIQTK